MSEQTMMSRPADDKPVVVVKDGTVYANSRDVASFFGKRHDHVTRDIENLIAKGVPNFGETPYVEVQNGRTYKSYDMDRDGFALLAMGFTGEKALQFKLRYIAQFNAMDAQLRKAADPIKALNDPMTLRCLLLDYSEQNIALKADLAEAKPKLEAFDRIATAIDGSLCVTDAAKTLQIAPRAMFNHLQANAWIYRRAGSAHWVGFQDKLRSGLLEHKVTEVTRGDGSRKITEQVLVTPKGLTKLSRDLGQLDFAAGMAKPPAPVGMAFASMQRGR